MNYFINATQNELKEGQYATAENATLWFTDANDNHKLILNDSTELVDKDDSLETPSKNVQATCDLKNSLMHDDAPTHKIGTTLRQSLDSDSKNGMLQRMNFDPSRLKFLHETKLDDALIIKNKRIH